MKFNRPYILGTTVAMVATAAFAPAAFAPAASASAGAGVITVTTLTTGNLDKKVRIHSDGVKFQTKVATDVRMQKLVFGPNSRTGWHHHPGMVLVVVETGSLTVWDSDCHSTTYGPGLANGAVFTESGDDPLEVSSAEGATNYVTLVAPDASPAVFRIEDAARSCA